MDAPRRRLSNRAIAGIIAGALLLVAVSIGILIRVTADAAWNAMEERIQVMMAEARARPTARPALRGLPEPGNAWTDYEAGLQVMAGIRSEIPTIAKFAFRRPDEDRAAIEKLLASHGKAIEHLRRGAGRAEYSFSYTWERGHEVDDPPTYSGQGLAQFAQARARVLAEQGRPGEGAALLMDVIQFGGDYRRNGTMLTHYMGTSMVGQALDQLRDLFAGGSLTAGDLASLERELEAADNSWADFRVVLSNDALQAACAFRADPRTTWGTEPASDWEAFRFGFSRRLMAADAVIHIGRFMERYVRLESLPWSEWLMAHLELEKEIESAPNPLVSKCHISVPASSTSQRHRRVQLRLLRAALHYRTSGEIPELEDPFGTRLRHSSSGDKLRIWSLGRDGVDQQGEGTWAESPQQARGPDVVLEIPK